MVSSVRPGRFWITSQDGAETVEYALVLGIFLTMAAAGILLAGGGIEDLFTRISSGLSSVLMP